MKIHENFLLALMWLGKKMSIPLQIKVQMKSMNKMCQIKKPGTFSNLKNRKLK